MNTVRRRRRVVVFCVLAPVHAALCFAAPAAPVDSRAEAALVEIADAYERLLDARLDAAGLPDNSAPALQDRADAEDALATRLRRIPSAGLPAAAASLRAALDWRLANARALRACHRPLWSLDHINGWQVTQPRRLAALRRDTPAAQDAALASLDALNAHIGQDADNLRHGLALGYSVPRSVVGRVIAELDALLALPAAQSPLLAVASHSPEAGFEARWRSRVEDSLLPSIRRYRAFLQVAYLPRARASLGLAALPGGRACYAAYLWQATTLRMTARQVAALGEETVARNRRELGELGRRLFGVGNPDALLRIVDAQPEQHFQSPEALLAFTRSALARSAALSVPLFNEMPAQAIEIEPLTPGEQDAGVPSHYQAQPDAERPAVFRLSLADWAHETTGAAEVTVAHETIPGHHLQVATARQLRAGARFADLGYNAAYVEGWANYAERLAEEQGFYQTDAAKTFRRAVLGRSLVVDPGVHVFGWSRARARAYMMAAGMSTTAADETLDRIVVQPAQLTAYESGGLLIFQLREQTRQRLGARFRLEAFHQRVLERGVVTLDDLERYVRHWQGD